VKASLKIKHFELRNISLPLSCDTFARFSVFWAKLRVTEDVVWQ